MHLQVTKGSVPIERQRMRSRRRDLLIVGLAVPASGLSWVMANNRIAFERENAIQAAVAQNSDRALMLQEYVSRTLATANLAAMHITELHRLGHLAIGRANKPRRIDSVISHDPSYLGLSVANAAGEIVATTLDGPQLTPNVSSHPAFTVHEAQDTGRLFVSKPSYSNLLRNDSVWISRRLNDAKGRFDGVVAINMDPAQLTAIFGKTAVKPSEVAWVVGLDGIIRSRRTGDNVSSGEDVSRGQVFRTQRLLEQGQFAGPGTLDGKMRLVSHRRIPGYPLFVSYSILEDEVLRSARRRSLGHIAVASFVTAAALMFALLVVHALRQRERRALELLESKARLEEAQRVAKIGDWAYSYESEAMSWSPHLYEIFERDPNLGAPPEDLKSMMSRESVGQMETAFRQLAWDGTPASWEMQVRLPSGRTAYLLVLAVPTRNEHGEIVGCHGTMQDITERKKLEALQDDLAHMSRVGAMNALTGTLSHELNQPLTAASNYLSAGQRVVLGLTDVKALQAAELMREAHGQVTRAGDIIQKMRNLITKGKSSRSVTSIDEVIDEALTIVAVTGACPQPVEVHAAPEVLMVFVDSVQIQQVILNLVRNACEAQKGRDAAPPRIKVFVQETARAAVSVIDSGPGLPEDAVQKLFEPFMSSKQGGLGLGLSISRTIIEAHGGTMQAQNVPGGGAVVSFALPLHGRRPRQQQD